MLEKSSISDNKLPNVPYMNTLIVGNVQLECFRTSGGIKKKYMYIFHA